MPHLDIRYSRNLEARTDLGGFCRSMADAMRDCPEFPLGGIRVRALACDHYEIADGHPENAFLDMVLRMGTGRSAETRKMLGDKLFAAASAALGPLFDTPHFALSFEVREIDPVLNWKKNSIHARLRSKDTGN